jgi:DNA-binding NtrC family response regulator
MPAPVVLVLNDQDLLNTLCAALEASDFAAAGFSNLMQALGALEASATVNHLITDTDLGAGQPNGASLAMIARRTRPHVRVLFIGSPEKQPFVEDIGIFVLSPVDPGRLLEIVHLWLTAKTPDTDEESPSH